MGYLIRLLGIVITKLTNLAVESLFSLNYFKTPSS